MFIPHNHKYITVPIKNECHPYPFSFVFVASFLFSGFLFFPMFLFSHISRLKVNQLQTSVKLYLTVLFTYPNHWGFLTGWHKYLFLAVSSLSFEIRNTFIIGTFIVARQRCLISNPIVGSHLGRMGDWLFEWDSRLLLLLTYRSHYTSRKILRIFLSDNGWISANPRCCAGTWESLFAQSCQLYSFI